MKNFLFVLIFISGPLFAETSYKTFFQTKTLGLLALEIEFSFIKGEQALAQKKYYQERIDQGVWGDWLCENTALFSKSLAVKVKVLNSDGQLIGEVSNDRYDMVKPTLVLGSTQSSSEEFTCDLLSLADQSTVFFNGYTGTINIEGYELGFTFFGKEVSALVNEVEANSYSVESLDTFELVNSTGKRVQWSILRSHAHYAESIEWGFLSIAQ